MKCLLVANIFPPINGGSAVVYEGLCQFSPIGSMHVLAPWRNYLSGKEIEGWQEHDAKAEYPVHRIELLRPSVVDSKSLLHSLWLHLVVDLPIKLRVLFKAIQLVRRNRIDVICVCELNSGSWLGISLKKLLGIPFINYIHGEEITTDSPYRLYGRNRRKYLEQADAVVAVSNFTRQNLIDLMHVSPDKIELIVNGVDARRFQPGPKDPALVTRYGLESKRVLLSVGRLVERKGIDMTLRALPRIIDACPDVHYLIVGTGEYEEQLKALASGLGIEAYVTFAGRVSQAELVAHYRLCDLFVLPNRELPNHDTEGFGLVFLEANACGKAVISGQDGGVLEAVPHGINGLNVCGADPKAIAEAILDLLTDHDKRRRMEHAGLELARQSSSAVQARIFYALCERLTARTAVP